MVSTIPYQLRNWRARWRALALGTEQRAGEIILRGALAAILIRANGRRYDLGTIGRRIVTTAGVNYLRDDFAAAAGGADISNIKYHDCGTGVTAEAIGDTGLVTPYGGARVAGTQTNANPKEYRSVATINFTSTLAITEHGIFTASTVGVLWDRTVFAPINVVNLDSIEFTYVLTIADGG